MISFCFVLFFGGRISQRVELSRSQLQAIGERVSLAQAKIEKIKGSKKAIKVAGVWPCPLAGRWSPKSSSFSSPHASEAAGCLLQLPLRLLPAHSPPTPTPGSGVSQAQQE